MLLVRLAQIPYFAVVWQTPQRGGLTRIVILPLSFLSKRLLLRFTFFFFFSFINLTKYTVHMKNEQYFQICYTWYTAQNVKKRMKESKVKMRLSCLEKNTKPK